MTREELIKELIEHEMTYLFLDDEQEEMLKNDTSIADEVFNAGIDIVFEETSEKIRGNKEIAKKMIAKSGFYIFDFTEDLQKDMELWELAIKKDVDVYTDSRATFAHNNKKLTLLAINNSIFGRDILKNTSEELKDDEEVVVPAIEKDILNLRFASERLQKDKKICFVAFKNGMKKMYSYQNIEPEIGHDYYVRTFVSEYQDKELPKQSLINFNIFLKELRNGKQLEDLEKEYK